MAIIIGCIRDFTTFIINYFPEIESEMYFLEFQLCRFYKVEVKVKQLGTHGII